MRRRKLILVVTVALLIAAGLVASQLRDFRSWAAMDRVPPSSPEYATAQRLLGYNHYGVEQGNWQEAKRHVDLALQAKPNDPKVLEDAGRVYVQVGLVPEGEAMLKSANTTVAAAFLASRRGT